MRTSQVSVYTERSPWAGWMLVLFWGSLGVGLGAVLLSSGPGAEGRWIGGTVIVVVGVLVQWVVAGLCVRLYRDELVVGVGSSGWIHKRVPYHQIQSLESVRYRPLREFGGWGIRFGREGKRAWTARGDRAVVLHLTDGTHLYVGSDHPKRLEQRIRAAMGG